MKGDLAHRREHGGDVISEKGVGPQCEVYQKSITTEGMTDEMIEGTGEMRFIRLGFLPARFNVISLTCSVTNLSRGPSRVTKLRSKQCTWTAAQIVRNGYSKGVP